MISVSTEVSSENKREKLTEKNQEESKVIDRGGSGGSKNEGRIKKGSFEDQRGLKKPWGLRRSLEEVEEGDNHQLGLK